MADLMRRAGVAASRAGLSRPHVSHLRGARIALVIRWFRWIATTSTPGDPTGSGRGFGTERDPARLVFFSDAVFALAFGLAAMLFNAIWGYARHDRRLLSTTIDAAGARAISWRFRLAVAWIATGTLLGALLPVLGIAVIAAFIPYYWLPIRGEIASAKPRRDRRGQA
jgi:hypothetical protein